MNHLRRRVEKLEAVVKREASSEDRFNKPYKLSDWTDEELDLFITALDQDKPLPPDLEAKLQLTDLVHTRTAGMSCDEIDAALEQLQQDENDDPNDDLSAYIDGGISK